MVLPKILNKIMFSAFRIIEKINPDAELTADNIDSAFKYRYFDSSKAKREVGWEPRIPFRKTIEDTYEWMKKGNSWSRSICGILSKNQ